ncbi:hypothetical protein CSUB01_06425, partial [Colletotrichum sublineola]
QTSEWSGTLTVIHSRSETNSPLSRRCGRSSRTSWPRSPSKTRGARTTARARRGTRKGH